MTKTQTADTARLAELDAIFAGRAYFPDLGQVTATQKRRLSWAESRGLVTREQHQWPWLDFGCCTKTYYVQVSSAAGAR